MDSKPVRIGIVVGEVSGDILGTGLIQSLKKRYPNAVFEGIGGPQMQALGFNSLYDMEELAVMGLFEVLARLRRLLHIRKQLVEHFIANPPDVFIGIDAPDFNLTLEKKLKQADIKTVHYVSPSVWAWRQKRVFKVEQATNLVLCLLPFEKQFYDKFSIPAEFVGHTLADQMPIEPDTVGARKKLNLDAGKPVLAVLPGSRNNEVKLLLEPFLQACELLAESIPDLQVVIPVANAKRHQQIESWLTQHPQLYSLTLVDKQSRDVMTASDVILLASGTATLEAMLCKKPMLVAYKFTALTAMILRRMIKMAYFSLPNLLAGEKKVTELLQEQVQPEVIAVELKRLFSQDNSELINLFTELHQQLNCDADERAADAVQRLLEA
ncbi:lipid-A-disaccharide synthase [Neptunicella marina]|uniref:lipid-A-disaccharide synthase n=1 Tax=Neptunicella marina TaxID=2125989 RepID=UPI0030CA32D8